jgi:Type VI secretion system effector, Hcp
MILMRLDGVSGKYCDITGGQNKYQYAGDAPNSTQVEGVEGTGVGWFPIESMNFGFKAKSESKTGGVAGTASHQQGGAGTRTPARPPAAKTQPTLTPKSDADEAFSTINVAKFVDGASIYLMRMAMQDRAKPKSDEKREKPRKADFHFLHSVAGSMTDATARTVFPYLMITLDNVLLKGWSINGSGDDRPTESVEIWFEKAAMRYMYTRTGKAWMGGLPVGWDQKANEPWIVPADHKFFEQPDKLS